MPNQFPTVKGNPYPLGTTVLPEHTVNFAFAMNTGEACGVILYHVESGKETKIPFTQQHKIGNVFCMQVKNIDPLLYQYNFYHGDTIVIDPYAKQIFGNEKWGKIPEELRAGFYTNDFEWEENGPILTDYSDSIFYLLHVRGFTKHASSKVKRKGTFSGILEKLEYLKELGVNTIELMPCYEFIEMEKPREIDCSVLSFSQDYKPKLNYWGYKNAYYFAPKASYGTKHNVINEFKSFVNELHKNKMEVVLQFYFDKTVTQAYILEVLKFWVLEYHIDGIHLLGDRLPIALLGTEPMLANTKILYHEIPIQEIYTSKEKPSYHNLALCNDEFMYNMRRFIKSDEGMIHNVINDIKINHDKCGQVHYITHANGFTLHDLVSYDRKHNEENNEHNLDGNPYNCSWNCGEEGKTRKKTILKLRMKQAKNACVLNFISQSTPLIKSGDEFLQTQNGNNNPYCQDNDISWLNWEQITSNQEFFDFMKQLIQFRKEHKILHMDLQLKMTDYLECGYPDISFHQEEPWKVQIDNLTRHIGILYSRIYESESMSRKDNHKFIYIIMNMHWCPHEFVLPALPKGMRWYMELDTNQIGFSRNELKNQRKLISKERSIYILVGE